MAKQFVSYEAFQSAVRMAGDRALGINPPKPGKTITVTVDEVREVAERAAALAFRMAGCMEQVDHPERFRPEPTLQEKITACEELVAARASA